MNLDLQNRKALVCGSTQGIGFAIAESLSSEGCQVTLMSRSESSLKSAVSRLDGDNKYLVADFQDTEQVFACKEDVEKENYDILINNAGGPPPGLVSEADWEDFDFAFKMHLKTSHLLSSWVVPGMKRNSFGRVINIISTSVKIPIAGLGVSNTVRGAMASWAKTMSNELGQFGITVNNILPGPISTGRLLAILESQAKKKGISTEEVTEEWKNSVPARRFGEPEEIGDLATFLCSSRAAYINGTSIPVDGGRTGTI